MISLWTRCTWSLSTPARASTTFTTWTSWVITAPPSPGGTNCSAPTTSTTATRGSRAWRRTSKARASHWPVFHTGPKKKKKPSARQHQHVHPSHRSVPFINYTGEPSKQNELSVEKKYSYTNRHHPWKHFLSVFYVNAVFPPVTTEENLSHFIICSMQYISGVKNKNSIFIGWWWYKNDWLIYRWCKGWSNMIGL